MRALQDTTLVLTFAMLEQVVSKGGLAAGSLRQLNDMLLQNRTQQLETKGKRLETIVSIILFFFVIIPFIVMILLPTGLTIMRSIGSF